MKLIKNTKAVTLRIYLKLILFAHYNTAIAAVIQDGYSFQFTKYEEHNWMSDEYSGGCYSSLMPPGVLTTFKR